MSSIPTSWELASLVCKFLIYIGVASIAGGSYCLWQFSDRSKLSLHRILSYILIGSLIGFQGVVANFLIQVGLINDNGFAGMFDWGMASLLLGAQLGDVTLYRLIGFVIVLLSCLFSLRRVTHLTRAPNQNFYGLIIAIHFFALLVISSSFRLAGHVSVLSIVPQIGIVIHVTAFALWIGSLYPLYKFTESSDLNFLRLIMKRFGDYAIVILALLVASGLIMILELLESPSELISSPYGWAFLSKLSLVVIIVGIAAANKLIFVPIIATQTDTRKLASSIRWEMLIASLILMLTSYFSTIVGPANPM
jgi:putative copper resistance protein D